MVQLKKIFESKKREAKSYFNTNEKIFSYLNEDEETSEIFLSYFDGIY